MHVSSSEAQEVVGEGECQTGIGVLGGTDSEVATLADVMQIEETLPGNVQRADHVSRADPFASAGILVKLQTQSEKIVCPLLVPLRARSARFLLVYDLCNMYLYVCLRCSHV